jgi:hypothetical protein
VAPKLGARLAMLKAGQDAARSWAGENLTFLANVVGGNTAMLRRVLEAAGYAFKGEAVRKKA